MDTIRIDRQYGKVFQYNAEMQAFVFVCNFYELGVRFDSDETIRSKAIAYLKSKKEI